ncbi:DUF6636 domain-containing protein [Nocardioides currus]|uniref:Ig-like domain-containing protein n=1 Tax=Nocardioides currus TaxID=2133958 RepID=A0A2R7YYF5_9ACTN|nr:DUF6636 domain-containing protein [Nocardioides currus]PUA81415.1 hypothetical protein C7S10_10415 [Nocardioides currus]
MQTGAWRSVMACAALVLMVSGCSADDGANVEAGDPTVTVTETQTVEPEPEPTASSSSADPVPVIDGPVVHEGQIVSPSGNIRCSLDYGVVCAVDENDYDSLPDDCDLDWADNQFYIDDTSGGRGICRGDTPFTADPVTLAYGSTTRVDIGACKSTEEAVVCWDTETGHGFRISRASYELF